MPFTHALIVNSARPTVSIAVNRSFSIIMACCTCAREVRHSPPDQTQQDVGHSSATHRFVLSHHIAVAMHHGSTGWCLYPSLPLILDELIRPCCWGVVWRGCLVNDDAWVVRCAVVDPRKHASCPRPSSFFSFSSFEDKFLFDKERVGPGLMVVDPLMSSSQLCSLVT